MHCGAVEYVQLAHAAYSEILTLSMNSTLVCNFEHSIRAHSDQIRRCGQKHQSSRTFEWGGSEKTQGPAAKIWNMTQLLEKRNPTSCWGGQSRKLAIRSEVTPQEEEPCLPCSIVAFRCLPSEDETDRRRDVLPRALQPCHKRVQSRESPCSRLALYRSPSWVFL